MRREKGEKGTTNYRLCHLQPSLFPPPRVISCLILQILNEQSKTNKANRGKQPYNLSSEFKSFLQRQFKLNEERGEPPIRVGVNLSEDDLWQ
uniref:Uncharacterized protein n=1 Tax=Cucumis melo TaxID=3656 RepID=A0A9I9EKH6_CUCME